MDNFQMILASGSPRRIEMMRRSGVEPLIIKPEVDETVSSELTPEQAVMYLALKKALAVEEQVEFKENQWLISADTIVCRETIMGKPQDEAEAVAMLSDLRGREHRVITGVAILSPGTTKRKVFAETTKVFFKDYDDQVIRDYIASGEVWDKAGAYAIQGGFRDQVDHIEGDYDNVVGFPWARFVEELKVLTEGTLDFTQTR
ncbi:MAG: septum formation protein Maf [Firmicutes bacterium]|nr:septum formation protein Maf [Bacillota bacterium]MBQ2270332.1 septum formation protein Maf [Bacillota bacterium]